MASCGSMPHVYPQPPTDKNTPLRQAPSLQILIKDTSPAAHLTLTFIILSFSAIEAPCFPASSLDPASIQRPYLYLHSTTGAMEANLRGVSTDYFNLTLTRS
jgi:hypothetical protein